MLEQTFAKLVFVQEVLEFVKDHKVGAAVSYSLGVLSAWLIFG